MADRKVSRDLWSVFGVDSEAELAELEPFVMLAREIKRDVARLAADDSADLDAIEDAIERIPREARAQVARAVFDNLDPDVQWAVLERVFDDDEIRDYLTAEREARRAWMGPAGWQRELAAAARAQRQLDTRAVPVNEQMTVGLFRDSDTRAAITRGHRSDTCARQLVLRATGDGEFRVIEDVFNPRGGLFVTRDYDRQVWERERLEAHTAVRVGSIHATAGGEELEPVLYPGARADVQRGSELIEGRLHLGFVMLGDVDVFAG